MKPQAAHLPPANTEATASAHVPTKQVLPKVVPLKNQNNLRRTSKTSSGMNSPIDTHYMTKKNLKSRLITDVDNEIPSDSELLSKAVESENLRGVQQLIQNPDINIDSIATGASKTPLLCFAAERGSVHTVSELIELAQTNLFRVAENNTDLHYVGFASGNMKNDYEIFQFEKSITVSIVDPKYTGFVNAGSHDQPTAPKTAVSDYDSLMNEIEISSAKNTLHSFASALSENMAPNAKLNIQVFPDADTFMKSGLNKNVDLIVGADYFLPNENGDLKTYDEQAHKDFTKLVHGHPDAYFAELAKTNDGFKIETI